MLSQTQFYDAIAEALGKKITSKDAKKVMDAAAKVVAGELKKNGAVKVPGLAVVRVKKKGAVPAGVRRVFGKDIECAAKPASVRVRMLAVQSLRNNLAP